MRRELRWGTVAAALVLAAFGPACGKSTEGLSFPPSSGGGDASTTGGGSSGGTFVGVAGTAGPYTDLLSSCAGEVPRAPLVRWSVVDIDGALDDVFGPGGATLARSIPSEDAGYFRDLSGSFVSALRQVATARARQLVADSDQFELCGAGETQATCVAPRLTAWGERLFRRPLTTQEIDAYVAQFRAAVSQQTPTAAARNALVSMVLSPYFVLRIERGALPAGELSAYEIAARLSHFATRRLPDEALRSSAATGALSAPSERVAQLRRLWDSPEGQRARALQHLAWFGLSDQLQIPVEPALQTDMFLQAEALVTDVFLNRGATLNALLTSSHQSLTGRLAEHYGLPAPSDEALGVDLDPKLFAGLLSQGSFLTRYPSASSRGQQLLGGLLCTTVPDHPPSFDATLPPGATPRERLTQSVQVSPVCNACHGMTDPLGFALEAFDDQGHLSGFDSSGSVPNAQSSSPTLVGNPGELGAAIAADFGGRTCAARHYLEYALDRLLSDGGDSGGVPSASGPPPSPPPNNPDSVWLQCLLQLSDSVDFDLNQVAEALVSSNLFRASSANGMHVVAFDNSIDPLEHALRETSQLQGSFLDATNEATLQRYLEGLQAAQEADLWENGAGAGGAGGGGAGAAGDNAGGAAAGGAAGAP